MTNETKAHEQSARGKLSRRGYTMSRSRQGDHYDNQGQFMVADDRNHCVLGDRFDATIDEVEALIRELGS
jgi:hypothetical protein